VRAKLGQLAYRVAGLQNRWQLGIAVSALRQSARKRSADLFIAHSEAALVVADELVSAGKCVGIDMEDWFSEDLLPEVRRSRPTAYLGRLERSVLLNARHSTCTSRAMSEALAREFGCKPPVVIYNAFPWADRKGMDGLSKDRREPGVPSIHWYSQTLGPARGLEDLLAALPMIAVPVQIHLRGRPAAGFPEWLAARVSPALRSRIYQHDLVSNDDLLSRIAEHDIGFAGEMPFCRSRDLTVTNKILQYLLAGLAVVASDTAGQREVASHAAGAVNLYPSGDSVSLASAIDRVLASANVLAAAKAASLRAAEERFSWECVAPRIVESVRRAIS
jgi:glycosyltransferase involved in cell wall biosynthesis